MSIKLVASDLDGTIIDRNNNISEKNFKAIDKLHEKNIDFAICTGKSYSVSKKVCEQFNANFGIFGNGTQIIDFRTGEELLRNTLSKEDLLFCSTLAKRYNFHIHLYTDNEIITEELKYMDLRNFLLRNKNSTESLKFKIVDDIIGYIEKNSIEVFSAVISTESAILPSFENLLSINKNIVYTYISKRGKYRDTTINKDYEYLNISPLHINKNEALNFLATHLEIAKKDMLAIGDNVNDLEMVKEAGIGVAVKDAYDDLKNVAKYVTNASATEGAFAEAIEKFI
mgnify:CR=1 FL=1